MTKDLFARSLSRARALASQQIDRVGRGDAGLAMTEISSSVRQMGGFGPSSLTRAHHRGCVYGHCILEQIENCSADVARSDLAPRSKPKDADFGMSRWPSCNDGR